MPFADGSFDAVLCCVSMAYLVGPVEVLREAARVLRPGGPIVITFSNRCFPTNAIRGRLKTDDERRDAIVLDYFDRAGTFNEAHPGLRTSAARGCRGDPLRAVTARAVTARLAVS
ncbi:MAG: class I SAM-dependent methyltransferase [Salinibacterium sp.]|nr:class I SAM-dependent methyltransferase [Salinibacterium sp.]